MKPIALPPLLSRWGTEASSLSKSEQGWKAIRSMLTPEPPLRVDLKGMYFTNDHKDRYTLRSNNNVSVGALCAAGPAWHSDNAGVCEAASLCPARAAAIDRVSGCHVLGYEYDSRASVCSADQRGIVYYHSAHSGTDHRPGPIARLVSVARLDRDPGDGLKIHPRAQQKTPL